MLYLKGHIHSVLSNVVQSRHYLFYQLSRQFKKGRIVVDTKHKYAASLQIREGTNMLSQTFLIVRETTLPINFIEFLRNGLRLFSSRDNAFSCQFIDWYLYRFTLFFQQENLCTFNYLPRRGRYERATKSVCKLLFMENHSHTITRRKRLLSLKDTALLSYSDTVLSRYFTFNVPEEG